MTHICRLNILAGATVTCDIKVKQKYIVLILIFLFLRLHNSSSDPKTEEQGTLGLSPREGFIYLLHHIIYLHITCLVASFAYIKQRMKSSLKSAVLE